MQNYSIIVPWLLVTLAGLDAPAPVSVVTAYELPASVVHVVLRNDDSTELDLDHPMLFDHTGRPLPLLWTAAEPSRVQPGEHGFVAYRFDDRARVTSTNAVEHHTLKTADAGVTYAVSGPPPIAATYLVHDSEANRAYLYLRNLRAESCTVTQVRIAGVSLGLAEPLPLPPGTVSLATGAWTSPGLGAYAVPDVAVEVETRELDTLVLAARLYTPEHSPAIADGPTPILIECLSHKFGNDVDAGATAVDRCNEAIGMVRTIKFCNVDLSGNATAKFGAIGDRCRIEPQTAYDEACRSARYIEPIFKLAQRTKTDVEPGIFFTILFGEHIHDADKPLIGLSQLRNVAYTCLAAGSKGFEFQPLTRTDIDPSFRRGLDAILAELDRLRPLVARSEPVTWASASDDSWYVPRALLCGDEGLLMIALPRRAAYSHGAQPRTDVLIRPPDPKHMLADEAIEIGGLHERIPIAQDTQQYEMRISFSEVVRVFLIRFLTPAND